MDSLLEASILDLPLPGRITDALLRAGLLQLEAICQLDAGALLDVLDRPACVELLRALLDRFWAPRWLSECVRWIDYEVCSAEAAEAGGYAPLTLPYCERHERMALERAMATLRRSQIGFVLVRDGGLSLWRKS